VGPGQGQKAILPVFFQKALMNLPINVFAPKKSILQLLYISDIIKAFQLIIESREVSGIYNLSSKDKISINKLAEEIVRITNSKSRIIYSNNEESNFSEITSQKAKKILNWEPEININDMLYLYFRNNPI
jgi:nucleoside-diphosphate-sugar epimerase